MKRENFIVNYLGKNTEAVDKLLALSWIVQTWKTMEEIAADNKTISADYLFETLEKNCPVGIIKVLLELDTSIEMTDRDDWIFDLLTSGKDTNVILKGLVEGSKEPANFNFGD